jgi:predicted HTH transcriptional regulator
MSGKTSEEMSGKIIEYIKKNNEITIPELAKLLGKSERTIERNLKKLQEEGRVKREGGTKGGHWQILEK